METKVDACDIHLQGSPIAKSVLEEMTKKDFEALKKAMAKKDPKAVAEMRAIMDANIKATIEDGIDFRLRKVSDIIKVQDIVNKLTRNGINGEPIKTYSEVVKQREKHLYGRNSVDTRARNLRNHYRNMQGHFETIFKTNENTTAPKSIRDIKKGSPQEEELYILIRSYEHEIDPATLTPEKVNGMLKTATEMQRLALSVVTYNAYTRKSMGQFGISTKFSKNFVVKRRYDWAAIEKMSPDQFASYMYRRLDIEKTFGSGVTEEQALFKLRDVYREMKQNAVEKLDITSGKEYMGSSANSMQVKFEWKGHKEAYEAFRDLSVGGLKDQIEQSANAMANKAISVSEFGYNAKEVSQAVSKELLARYNETPSTMDQWRLAKIQRAEKELTGQQHLIQGSMTNFSNNMRFFQAFTKLGNAVTGTVLDAVDNGRQSFYMNGSFFSGVKDYMQGFAKVTAGMNDAEKLELAHTMNLIFSHLSNAEGMRLASGDIATRGGRITNLIQEHGSKAINMATLLPFQTARSNLASGIAGSRSFAKLIDSAKKGELNKFQKDFLKEYGFSDNEVKALASGAFERTANWSDTPIFTGTGIRQALMDQSPEKVAKALGVAPEVAGQAVLDLATKVESVVNDWASRGTPKPELATKTLMGKNIENEGVRVAIGLMTQFLDTPVAQGQYMMELAEKLYRVNDGNLMGVIKDGAVPSAAYLTTGLTLYVAADAMMSAVTNKASMIDKYNNGDKEARNSIMLNAIGRTGYVPFVFEMIESQMNSGYNKTALDTFGSPALGTLRDTLRVMQGLDGEGGIGLDEYIKRQLPTNAIVPRAINNWSGKYFWDDNSGSFNSSGTFPQIGSN